MAQGQLFQPWKPFQSALCVCVYVCVCVCVCGLSDRALVLLAKHQKHTLELCRVFWCKGITAKGMRVLGDACALLSRSVDFILYNSNSLIIYQTALKYSTWIDWNKPIPLASLLHHCVMPPNDKPNPYPFEHKDAWKRVNEFELHLSNVTALEFNECTAAHVVLNVCTHAHIHIHKHTNTNIYIHNTPPRI